MGSLKPTTRILVIFTLFLPKTVVDCRNKRFPLLHDGRGANGLVLSPVRLDPRSARDGVETRWFMVYFINVFFIHSGLLILSFTLALVVTILTSTYIGKQRKSGKKNLVASATTRPFRVRRRGRWWCHVATGTVDLGLGLGLGSGLGSCCDSDLSVFVCRFWRI